MRKVKIFKKGGDYYGSQEKESCKKETSQKRQKEIISKVF